MKKVALISGVALFSPYLVLAGVLNEYPVIDILNSLKNIVRFALPVIISLAVLLFLWGLVKYVMHSDDIEARKSSRMLMIWGIVIIFVMVSVWGLVNFLGSVVNVSWYNYAKPAPSLPPF